MKKLMVSAIGAIGLAALFYTAAASAEKTVSATNGSKATATVFVDKETGCEYLVFNQAGNMAVTARHKNGMPVCKNISAVNGKK